MRPTSRNTFLTLLAVLAVGLSAGHASATYQPFPEINPLTKTYNWEGDNEGTCWIVSCDNRSRYCCTVDKPITSD